MVNIKVKILALFELVCLAVAICSCGIEKETDDYRSRPFSCKIEFSLGKTDICASLTVRDAENIRMEILSPDILSGTVIYEDGRTEYRGMTVKTDAFEELLSYGCALVPKGEASKGSKVKNRKELVCFTVKNEGEGGKIYEIYVEKSSGHPKEIRFDGETVFVREFEFLD